MSAIAASSHVKPITEQAWETKKAELAFRHFVRQAWHVVEPDTKLVPGFYIDAICDHLQAVFEGDIKRLVITLPPGFLKSTIVSVLFPAWMWISKPSFRFLTTSHEADLAMRDAVRSRRVIMSDWYQARWGDRFAMTTDQNVKTRYENDHTGHRISLGTESGITGKRGDMILCDDPHDAEDAYSPVKLESTVRWWNETVPSRLNDPKHGAKIVIQQRIHVSDLAGVVIAQGYEHLDLPMEYNPDDVSPVTSIGWRDPRTEPGELLDPVRYGPAEVTEKREELGSQMYAAQYQQRPVSAEGGILKRHWFQPYEARHPSATTIIQSWDTAFKLGTENDYSVCTTWAYGMTGAYLLDVYRDRLEFPDLTRAVQQQYTRFRPTAVLIEDKASGQSLIQEMRARSDIPIIGVPVVKDKVARVNEVSPKIEAGRVLLPVAATWLDEALHELTAFPLAAHDDIVDSVAQALTWLFARDEGGEYSGTWLPDGDDDEEEPLW